MSHTRPYRTHTFEKVQTLHPPATLPTTCNTPEVVLEMYLKVYTYTTHTCTYRHTGTTPNPFRLLSIINQDGGTLFLIYNCHILLYLTFLKCYFLFLFVVVNDFECCLLLLRFMLLSCPITKLDPTGPVANKQIVTLPT